MRPPERPVELCSGVMVSVGFVILNCFHGQAPTVQGSGLGSKVAAVYCEAPIEGI